MATGSDVPAIPGGGPQQPQDAADVPYVERLRTPWWWYFAAAFVAAILAAEFHVGGFAILTDWIPFCTLVPLAVVVVFAMGRSRLQIRDGEVSIRGAHLPVGYISGAIALDARTLRLVVGREGDPMAFVQIRPWIGPGVQFWIDDDEDPTPYWVVSTRHPERVVRALNAVRRRPAR